MILVGGVLLANLLAQGVDRAVGGDQPGGVAGSSYATAPAGLAAYATLLAHYGHDVESQRGDDRARAPCLPTRPRSSSSPTGLTDDDASALLQFVAAGGRLVVGGASPFYLDKLRDTPPRWQTTGEHVVDGDRSRVRRRARRSTPRASDRGRRRARDARSSAATRSALLTREAVGRGEIFFLADASPLENARPRRGRQRRLRARARGRRRPARRLPRRCARLRRRAAAGRPFPDRWKVALVLVAVAAARVRVVARPPLRSARSTVARAAARARRVRARAVGQPRAHA